ncbi:MAG: bifunctional precorrin-2 dehydrogenase/sirohydrochlorin ferrochelatase [Ruminiclostridium sp.]|nr:bifunctional precorrin-2 dehydrogenase/sirohydrochlorin ferrochelatase [Ruminiclostridium sp.]
MAFFPFFIDLAGKKILIVGGGRVALRKAEKLLPFGADIAAVSPVFCDGFPTLGTVSLYCREFRDSDIDGAFAVIAATDDRALNTHIYRICTERNILVNTVDTPEDCGFYFPALVQSGNVTCGISTGGESPIFARYIKEKVAGVLDGKTLAAGEILARYRPVIKRRFDTEEQRKSAAEKLLERCTDGSKLPADEEINELLESL